MGCTAPMNYIKRTIYLVGRTAEVQFPTGYQFWLGDDERWELCKYYSHKWDRL